MKYIGGDKPHIDRYHTQHNSQDFAELELLEVGYKTYNFATISDIVGVEIFCYFDQILLRITIFVLTSNGRV